MKKLPEEGRGRGMHTVQTWQEISKGGGEAPRIEEIQQMLRGGEDGLMLSRDEVEQKITDYFRSKICTIENEETGQTVWKSAPTKSELAAKLGISLSTLARYNRGEYSGGRTYQGMTSEVCEPESFPIIQRAMLIISDFYERQLSLNKNNSGVIFWLLNAQNEKWSNEQEIHVAKTEEVEIKPLALQLEEAGLVWDETLKDFVPKGEAKNG